MLLALFLKLEVFLHHAWHCRHNPWGKEQGLVQLLLACHIKDDLNKSWCLYLLGMFSFFQTNLQKLCLKDLSRFLIHFHSLESKYAFAKIDLLLKYMVLWHNNPNIHYHYHISLMHIFYFSHIKQSLNYEVKITRRTTLLNEV